MYQNLDRLIRLGTPSLGENLLSGCLSNVAEMQTIAAILKKRNGFYAFESALHVFPYGNDLGFQDVISWNVGELWKGEYGGLADMYTFFAEDIFGVQFGIYDGMIYVFDPETGNSRPFANDVEGWAEAILNDYNLHTGYSLAHQWQSQNGHLPAGYRLTPRIPFVMNGPYTVANLDAQESISAMKSRASLALQIRHLPDGTKVKFKVV